VRHPQTNGKVERKFRTVKEYLKEKYGIELKELDKDTILQKIVYMNHCAETCDTFLCVTQIETCLNRQILNIPFRLPER